MCYQGPWGSWEEGDPSGTADGHVHSHGWGLLGTCLHGSLAEGLGPGLAPAKMVQQEFPSLSLGVLPWDHPPSHQEEEEGGCTLPHLCPLPFQAGWHPAAEVADEGGRGLRVSSLGPVTSAMHPQRPPSCQHLTAEVLINTQPSLITSYMHTPS